MKADVSTPPELVIFDCDGVLVDSEPLANAVLAAAVVELGLDLDLAEVQRRFIGRSMGFVVESLEQERGQALPEGWLDALQQRTFRAFERELRPVRGVTEALERIPLRRCVASSGAHEKMRLTLGLTGLLETFRGSIFSATEVARGKPHPDLFLHAAERMGTPPERCTVVEDSLPGVQGARAAGMRVLGYVERSDAVALRRAGAQTFDTMADLPALLGLEPRAATDPH